MPRVQFSHDLDAFTYCPAMHEEHFVRSLLLSSPSGHSVHSTCASAFVASSSLYLPAGQSEQAPAPAEAACHPSSHTSHAPDDVAPVVDEAEPAGHRVQLTLRPAVVRYRPASQRVQFARPVSAA